MMGDTRRSLHDILADLDAVFCNCGWNREVGPHDTPLCRPPAGHGVVVSVPDDVAARVAAIRERRADWLACIHPTHAADIDFLCDALEAAIRAREDALACITRYGDEGALRALEAANARIERAEAAREMAERIANDVAGERDRAEAALARVREAVPCAASRCGKTRAAHDAKHGTPGWTGHAFVSPVWFEAALAEPTADVLGAHGVPAEDAAKIDAKLAAARAKVAETGEAAT